MGEPCSRLLAWMPICCDKNLNPRLWALFAELTLQTKFRVHPADPILHTSIYL